MELKTIRDNPTIRWIVFGLVTTLMFSTYWFQDFFSGLKPLMESSWKISSADFGSIIQWTTLANCFGMIIVGGIILDKWGARIAGLIFIGIATIGALLVAFGANKYFFTDIESNLWVIKIGRLFFGIGLEVTCVIATKIIAKWFLVAGVAFAMSLNTSSGRLGSAMSTAFSVDIAHGQISTAANFAAMLVAVAFLCYIIYLIFFDGRLNKQLIKLNKETDEKEKPFQFSDFKEIITSKPFWIISMLCVSFYAAVFPFMQYCPDMLANKFGFSHEIAPKIAALIPIASMIFMPIFGKIMDKKGKAATMVIIGSALLIIAHLSLSLMNGVFFAYFGLFALGMAFSIVPAAMWPCLPKIIDQNKLGTAFATVFTIQNWGLMGLFWGIGKVLDVSNETNLTAIRAGQMNYDYTYPILMLVGLGLIAIFFAYQLKRADKKYNYGLENPRK